MAEIALRYAVLHHEDIADPHFDILIETRPGSDLATWRSPIWPIEAVTEMVRVKDHRRLYLEYEGQLTERRGSVQRVAGGNCRLEIGENAVWTVRFSDRPGTLRIRQINGNRWEGMAGQ